MLSTRSAGFSATLASLVGLLTAVAATAVGAQTASSTHQYVAIGSSFAAGPGIGTTALDSPLPCARSAENYPHVLAGLRHLSLVDVTCSGATTNDVLRGGQFLLPPQLDAITPQTQLVTVTIGGNDVFLMANLIAMSCDMRSGGCTVVPDTMVEDRFSSLGNALRQIVAGARTRSPKVRVVFVNYFTVLPEKGTCTRVHLSAAEADHMRGVAARLADITRRWQRKPVQVCSIWPRSATAMTHAPAILGCWVHVVRRAVLSPRFTPPVRPCRR